MEETSSFFVVESEISQDDIFQTLDKQQIENEKKIWKDLISSKEWRLTEGHFHLCSKKIESIVDKALSLYKEGSLPLRIKEDSDIRIGIEAYFGDLNSFPSNGSRLSHLKRVLDCIGKTKSPIWREISNLIESFQSN